MKAISLTQPMAWAIFNGKDVENRNWRTNYRGPILIHASLKFDTDHFLWMTENGERLKIPDFPDDFLHGFILGMVKLVSVMKKDAEGNINYLDELCPPGNRSYGSPWFSGPYGFVLEDARRFSKPIPYRGMPGVFNVPDDIVKEVKQ